MSGSNGTGKPPTATMNTSSAAAPRRLLDLAYVLIKTAIACANDSERKGPPHAFSVCKEGEIRVLNELWNCVKDNPFVAMEIVPDAADSGRAIVMLVKQPNSG